MKNYKFIITLIYIVLSGVAIAQSSGINNQSCENSFLLCEPGFGQVVSCDYQSLDFWYVVYNEVALTGFTFSSNHGFDQITYYGPFTNSYIDCGSLQNYLLMSENDGVLSSTAASLQVGFYIVHAKMLTCDDLIVWTVNGDFSCGDGADPAPTDCDNCIGSFSPIPGKEYIISAWVREKFASPSKTTFDYPQIEISYSFNPLVPREVFIASGEIIEGWQKIEQSFTIPVDASEIKVSLLTTYSEVYFDDVRIFPVDGSLKSFVYDPMTSRLNAVLDELNYATIYEYDEEGNLVRVKKETEKGVLTIQEIRKNVTH